MTHEILQSDVDLARRLLAARRPNKEIVAALMLRGIDVAEAERLVDDLSQGRRVKVRVDVGGSRQPSSEPVNEPSELEQDVRSSEPSGSRSRVRLWFVVMVLVLGGGLAAVVMQYRKSYHKETAVLLNELDSLARELQRAESNFPGGAATYPAGEDSEALKQYQKLKSQIGKRRLDEAEQAKLQMARLNGGTSAASRTIFRSKAIVELGSAGLRVEGHQVVATNALSVLQKALGPPSRTNWVASSSTVLYAFDRQGILLFAPRNTQPNGLLLDFEGEGGEYGTQAPFSGVLRIGTQEIHSQTPASILRSNPELTLTNAPSDGRILAGRCNGFETICSFLKSADRLSSVEIRLGK
jgi:hypothetical protein